jgi:hypothetical protein
MLSFTVPLDENDQMLSPLGGRWRGVGEPLDGGAPSPHSDFEGLSVAFGRMRPPSVRQ